MRRSNCEMKTDGSFEALVNQDTYHRTPNKLQRSGAEAELSNHLISPNWWRHVGDTCPVTQRATWRPGLTRGGKMRFYILRANEVDTISSRATNSF